MGRDGLKPVPGGCWSRGVASGDPSPGGAFRDSGPSVPWAWGAGTTDLQSEH